MPSLELPAGFRFHPTDEELVRHYLCRKCASLPITVPIIAEVDLYKFDPWELPSMASYGEKEWYFFSPRDRKYPNGSRPNRSAASGYWKATGADKPIGHPKPLAIKKALVFYSGKAPKGEKSNWIMHEYRLAHVDRSVRSTNNLRLDDWVLCRIYNKKGSIQKHLGGGGEAISNKKVMMSPSVSEMEDRKPEIMAPPPPPAMNDYLYFDPSDSLPRLHTDSSCSEHHVLSPEFNCEVQSEPKVKSEWGSIGTSNGGDFPYNYIDATISAAIDRSSSVNPTLFDVVGSSFQMPPLQDMYNIYLQKPF